MSDWPDCLRTEQSTAEDQVYEALQLKGLYAFERDWVLIVTDEGVQAVRRDDATKAMVNAAVQITLPDFCAVKERKPVYLDGGFISNKGFPKIHLSLNTSKRDDRINSLLTLNGWPPLRIPYNARKLPKYKVKEIVQEMKEFLENA